MIRIVQTLLICSMHQPIGDLSLIHHGDPLLQLNNHVYNHAIIISTTYYPIIVLFMYLPLIVS